MGDDYKQDSCDSPNNYDTDGSREDNSPDGSPGPDPEEEVEETEEDSEETDSL